MLEKIEKLTAEIESLQATNAEELEVLRIKYLSKKGKRCRNVSLFLLFL